MNLHLVVVSGCRRPIIPSRQTVSAAEHELLYPPPLLVTKFMLLFLPSFIFPITLYTPYITLYTPVQPRAHLPGGNTEGL